MTINFVKERAKRRRKLLAEKRRLLKITAKKSISRVDKALIDLPIRTKVFETTTPLPKITVQNKPLTCRAVEKRRLKAVELWMN
ncbi:hypothetical protein [Gallibacterium anatis]|uniref:hypothetical protein n=1 Tax=Gallibacterium anatis TaxID=750 RepID=UPI0005314752|nr:hypothetical protein [Gallibacterium anatis]KGQ44496.1 hypothetical protein JP29_09120 [Gallibacterium anatis]